MATLNITKWSKSRAKESRGEHQWGEQGRSSILGKDRILLLCSGVELRLLWCAGLYGWTLITKGLWDHSSLARSLLKCWDRGVSERRWHNFQAYGQKQHNRFIDLQFVWSFTRHVSKCKPAVKDSRALQVFYASRHTGRIHILYQQYSASVVL